MVAVAPLRVRVSDPDPIYGGLLNVGKSLGFLQDISDPHIGMGAEWESAPCGQAGFAPGVCDDALEIDPDDEKEFITSIPHQDVQPFAIYTGIECDIFRDNYEELTKGLLERGESYAVEKAVQALVLDNSPTAINSGDPTSIVDAIGLLEQFIGSTGSGRGLIHTSRYGAAWLANTRGIKSDQDFHLWTAQGTPIINGAGYSVGTGLEGSQFWMWATGSMHVFRSAEVQYTETPALGRNKKDALAERFYSVGADCFVVKVLVDPSLDTIPIPPEETP